APARGGGGPAAGAADEAPVRHHHPAGRLPRHDLELLGEQRDVQHAVLDLDAGADAAAFGREHATPDGVADPPRLLLPPFDRPPDALGGCGELARRLDAHRYRPLPSALPRRACIVSRIESTSTSATTAGIALIANDAPNPNA